MANKDYDMDKAEKIAVGTALGVVLILIFTPIFLPNLIWQNTTPEDALSIYIECENRGDIKGLVDLSIVSFSDYEHYLEIIADMEEEYESFDIYSISIDNISVHYEDDIKLRAIIMIRKYVEKLENHYNISIQEYCIISCTKTQNIDGKIRIFDDYIISVRVNSLWYIGHSYYTIPSLL